MTKESVDIVLGACPPFNPETPHLGIAYLDEYLNHHGFKSTVYDLSLEVYHQATGDAPLLWEAPSWKKWQEEGFADEFCVNQEPVLSRCVYEMLAGDPIAVCLSVHLFNSIITMNLIRFIKKLRPGIRVILGGPGFYTVEAEDGPKLCLFGYPLYDDAHRRRVLDGWLEAADAVVLGEGEETLAEIMSRLRQGQDLDGILGTARVRQGRHEINPDRPLIEDLDSVPFPTYRNFNLGLYKGSLLPVITSRGCRNRCTFCVEHRRWRDVIRYRSPAHVVDELEHHVEHNNTTFFKGCDSLFNAKPERLAGICEEIIRRKLDIQWGGNLMVHKKMDRPFFDLCKLAGAHTFTFGVESGSPSVLRLMKKPLSIKYAERNLKDCHEAGVQAFVNVVVGFPGETEEDFQQTLGFLYRNRRNIDAANVVRTCILYHSTDIANRPEEYGLAPEQVKNLPDLYGVPDWVDKNGLDFAERKRRHARLQEVLIDQGVRLDTQRLPANWPRRQEIIDDPGHWEWFGSLVDAPGTGSLPLGTMLLIALEHPEPRVRAAAAKMVKFIRDDSFLPRLVDGLTDDSDLVREHCARAIGTLGHGDHVAHLKPLLHKFDELDDSMKHDLQPLYEHFLQQLAERERQE